MNIVEKGIMRGPRIDLAFQTEFNTSLDLASGAQVWGDHLPLEEAMEGDLCGIRVYGHPLGGILPPTIKELRLAVQFMLRCKAQNKPLYVHCEHGVDRTGMVCAAFRVIAQNWSPMMAAREALTHGMHWVYLPWLIQLWRLK